MQGHHPGPGQPPRGPLDRPRLLPSLPPGEAEHGAIGDGLGEAGTQSQGNPPKVGGDCVQGTRGNAEPACDTVLLLERKVFLEAPRAASSPLTRGPSCLSGHAPGLRPGPAWSGALGRVCVWSRAAPTSLHPSRHPCLGWMVVPAHFSL